MWRFSRCLIQLASLVVVALGEANIELELAVPPIGPVGGLHADPHDIHVVHEGGVGELPPPPSYGALPHHPHEVPPVGHHVPAPVASYHTPAPAYHPAKPAYHPTKPAYHPPVTPVYVSATPHPYSPAPSYHDHGAIKPNHLPLAEKHEYHHRSDYGHPHPPPPPPPHPHYKHHDYSIPECAYNSKYNYNASFCLVDDYYPIDTIKYEISRNLPIIDRVLTDVSYQSADNLVEGVSKIEEESYTYGHYYGDHLKQDISNYNYAPDYSQKGGYICPSDIYYGRPKRAANTYGEWKVIVNLPEEYLHKGYGAEYARFSQTQRLEQCLYPSLPCSYIHPAIPSSCVQKFSFVRLLAYTRAQGLHMDSFKLPSACSCHLKPDHHYG